MLPGRHSYLLRALVALMVVQTLVAGPALGKTIVPDDAVAESQAIRIEISQPAPSLPANRQMSITVSVDAAAPAEYFEVRLRVRRPSGKLLYQKTEIRTAVPAGRQSVTFEHDLSTTELEQGRYPIEVRVLATGTRATSATSRLLVLDPGTAALPVAIVANALDAPAVTMDGRFMRDPAADTRLRDELAKLTQLATADGHTLSLAVPPVLVEQLARAAAGYETTAGVVVSSDQDPAVRAGSVVRSLEDAIAAGSIDLIDVPYALPDLAGLHEMGGDADLDLHWTRSDEVNAAVLHSVADPTVAYLGPHLTPAALTSLVRRGVKRVIAPASALRSAEATPTPGSYQVPGSGIEVVIADERAARGAAEGADAFYDALFDRLGDGPVVVVLDVGPGGEASADDVGNALAWIEAASWLRTAAVTDLPTLGKPKAAELARAEANGSNWAQIAEARTATTAYAQAAAPGDPGAASAVRGLLSAESSLWHTRAGGDGAQALELATSALTYVTGQFAKVRLDTTNVTLSGSKGEIPLTLINDTGTTLRLTLRATSASGLASSPPREIELQPTQNFLKIPVDLGNALSDQLTVVVRAGEFTVAEKAVTVRASYIDRLATIGMVLLVLGGLLVYIKRQVGTARAGSIVQDTDVPADDGGQ